MLQIITLLNFSFRVFCFVSLAFSLNNSEFPLLDFIALICFHPIKRVKMTVSMIEKTPESEFPSTKNTEFPSNEFYCLDRRIKCIVHNIFACKKKKTETMKHIGIRFVSSTIIDRHIYNIVH